MMLNEKETLYFDRGLRKYECTLKLNMTSKNSKGKERVIYQDPDENEDFDSL